MTESEIRAFFEAEKSIAALLLRKLNQYVKVLDDAKKAGDKDGADRANKVLSMLDTISCDLSDIDYMFGEVVKATKKKESEGAA